jgi:hypothetical protein
MNLGDFNFLTDDGIDQVVFTTSGLRASGGASTLLISHTVGHPFLPFVSYSLDNISWYSAMLPRYAGTGPDANVICNVTASTVRLSLFVSGDIYYRVVGIEP